MMQALQENKWFFTALAFFTAGFVLLYFDHFGPLEYRWSAEDNSYCWLIPPLFGYLAWQQRHRLCESPGGSAPWGYALMLLTAGLYLVGLLGSLETLIYGSMWTAIMAGFVLLFGLPSLRSLAFPFLVLAFAVPLPPFVIRLMTFRLKLLSSELAVNMLNAMSIPAYGEGNVIDMGITKLQIVDACSGLRYLLPSILLSLLIGHFFHTRLWKKGVLLLLSAPVTLVSNAFRIAMTGVLVAFVSPEFGEGFLHDFSGWVVYMLSLLLLGGCSMLLRRVHPSVRGKETEPEACPPPQGMASIWPHAMLCALLFACTLFAGNALLERQNVPERTSFETFPMEIGDWRGRRLFLSEEVLAQLWADDYVTGTYQHQPTGTSMHMLVSYYKRQTATHTAHAPTSCLVGSGWFMENKEVLPPSPATGRDFPVTRMVLSQAGTTVVSNFWFDQRGRHVVDEYENKFWLVWDSFSKGRSDGALVRLELFLKDGQSLEEGQRLLDGFAGDLKALLADHVPGDRATQTATHLAE